MGLDSPNGSSIGILDLLTPEQFVTAILVAILSTIVLSLGIYLIDFIGMRWFGWNDRRVYEWLFATDYSKKNLE